MRRVIVQELVTVDGFAAGLNGELDFFDAGGDLTEVERDDLRILEGIDTVLLGATTYRGFVEFWPTEAANDEMMADAVNTIPKVVLSSTLHSAPWGDFPEARLLRGPAVDEVARLKQDEGKDIMVWGSLSVAQALFVAGLVDEVNLRVCPIALGDGRRLFPEGKDSLGLRLIEAKPYESGVVSLRYDAQAIDTRAPVGLPNYPRQQ